MSSNVSADQHMRVRYNQREEGDGEVYEEKEVVIYDNVDCVRGPLSHIRVFHFNEKRQSRFNNLSNSYNQSQEVKQLQVQITEILANNSREKDETKKLMMKTKECPEGWKRFGCSCYFKSTEKKTWSDSSKFCQDRGSDLVIINSKEEQDFITDFNENEESWIGLRTTENKTASTGYRWKWVDDSPLTETFWATAELGNPTNWFAAVCCDQQGKWTRSGYNKNPDTNYRNWICEK
ncbi:CD209 antigen-like protein C isoform X2 [Channa argus]|uniref:CD209 antigen-like protein C isoform X2 n=1 Tax=Channa argus TaxID=215402 RepID=UPI00352289AD